MKRCFICAALLFVVALCGCSKQTDIAGNTTNSLEHTPTQTENQTTQNLPTDRVPESPSATEATDPTEKEVVTPTRDEVYAARELALEGMTEDQIEDLTEFVKAANLWLEHKYLYGTFFEMLADPDYPTWNYFHETGEIQIGWAYSGDIDRAATCESEGLTKNAFYEKYGTPVSATNLYDAEGFADRIGSFQENVQNEALIADLQYIIDKSLLARDTHDVTYVYKLYRALHDLDYFLLRYGPEDVGPYVSDASTVSKYYGMLSIYA